MFMSTVYINPGHIAHLSEHRGYYNALREGKINLDLNPATTFTRVVVNEEASQLILLLWAIQNSLNLN